MTIVKIHRANGFSPVSNPLSSVSENSSYFHIQVCEILLYPTRTGTIISRLKALSATLCG